MNLILLGAPGAGKGTQAEVPHRKNWASRPSATGNILRAAVNGGHRDGPEGQELQWTPAGWSPTTVIIGILKERLAQPDCAKGLYPGRGCPRTHRPGRGH